MNDNLIKNLTKAIKELTEVLKNKGISIPDNKNNQDKNSVDNKRVKIEHQNAMTSPMVGTVYLSPEPGAKNFIKQGETIKKGDTLLIIEAMKTFNPIKAEKNGKIEKILVNDAEPVEFGQPLVVIK
tara:strand:+ start:7484 stop:7861 length:378 start_codon:yes stop_codon:yes gene_type:complete